MNSNNNGNSGDDEDALLADRISSDNPFPNAAGMDMKQIAQKIHALEKKAYGPKNMVLLLCTIVIMGICIVALLIMNCQLGDKIHKIQEKISKMEENLERQISELNNGTHGMHEQIKEITKFIKLDPITNELNPADCGSELTVSRDGLKVTLTESDLAMNSIRAFAPIFNFVDFKPSIDFYFEVQFIENNGYIHIGFCTKQFPLQGKLLGELENSIGIYRPNGIWIDGSETKFKNTDFFKKLDVIGLGIIHSPTNSTVAKCFATLNGNLLGKVDLPPKFATLEVNRQLFPAISIYRIYDSVRANFGKEPFRFNVSAELFQ